MSLTPQHILQQLLPSHAQPNAQGSGSAPVNIALIKYWGKRNLPLNLPVTDSLSVGLRTLGSHTTIALCTGPDQITLDGQLQSADSSFYQRTRSFLDWFRPTPETGFIVDTQNDVPTGAGLASSASGFAALVLALNDLFQWQLSTQHLSVIARMGSGSACRSLWDGLVHWHKGERADGLDSYGHPLDIQLPSLRIGLMTLSAKAKPVSSRNGMQRTQHGTSLYPAWPPMVAQHLTDMQTALHSGDIARIGSIAEHNALAMHASMLSAWPALCYWLPETLHSLQCLWQAREQGLNCWATLDAGPNVKLIFDARDETEVSTLFPEMKVVQPFA